MHVLHFGHSNKSLVISYRYFNFQLNDNIKLRIFYVITCHIYIYIYFFCEVPFDYTFCILYRILCLYLIWFVNFSCCSFLSSLIVWTSTRYIFCKYFLSIFEYSLGILIVTFIIEQTFSALIKSDLLGLSLNTLSVLSLISHHSIQSTYTFTCFEIYI